MLNLVELLSQKDKKLMTDYINLYGIGKEDFIGIDKYLKYWGESKKTLYKIFGDKFQIEIPVTYEKSDKEMALRFENLLSHSFIKKIMSVMDENGFNNSDLCDFLSLRILKLTPFLNDSIAASIKFTSKANGKEIRLQKGMKPIRALQRIVSAFPNLLSMDDFEDFRISHSMCLNDKYIHGTLVLSIHPFDYITMSDNDSDWSSCMSWVHDGCYHTGTIEMMNSNNVICAYLKSNNDYNFSKHTKNDDFVWNNKKWRQLIIMNKDIIVAGKPYPYVNKDMTLKAIETLKILAKENKNWEYSYGPELYLDMKHIYSLEAMEHNRAWLHNNNAFKHNILFDTKGMYNDMLNDNHTEYWCYRNKVPKMRIFSYSGKANCACCNKDNLLEEANNYEYDYNERYYNTDSIVCSYCKNLGSCYNCGSYVGQKSLRSLGQYQDLCPNCIQRMFRKCPCCGEGYINKNMIWSNNEVIGIKLQDKVHYDSFDKICTYCDYYLYTEKELKNTNRNRILPYSDMEIVPVYACDKCKEKLIIAGLITITSLPASEEHINSYYWRPKSKKCYITTKIYTAKEIEEHPMFNHMLYDNFENNKVIITD